MKEPKYSLGEIVNSRYDNNPKAMITWVEKSTLREGEWVYGVSPDGAGYEEDFEDSKRR